MRKHAAQSSGGKPITRLRTKTFTTTYASIDSQLKVAKRATRKQWRCIVYIVHYIGFTLR